MRPTFQSAIVLLTLALAAGGALGVETPIKPTQGALQAIGADGKPLGACPLKHTDVQVALSGHICYVSVTQEFENPFDHKIEAVYVFPLSANAAVSEMTMTVGDRIVIGKVKPREEARRIYEQAKSKGHVASLLDQERPNIFTQSVANIEPGKKVKITIGYTETLKYEDGVYSFAFPMVVGPRYIPGFKPAPSHGKPEPVPMPMPMPPGGRARKAQPQPEPVVLEKAESKQVPDADRITPPITPKGTRAGHDISVKVFLDAGTKVTSLKSRQHEIAIKWADADHTRATIALADMKTIPNKDFVLEFSTATERIEDAMLSHNDKRGGFFTLILQPPKRIPPKLIRSRELIFVIDSSGSMSGFPIETAKAVMSRCIKNLRPQDKLNLITFAGHTTMLWTEPVANTEANRSKALGFLKNLRGGGGTEMMKAIRACLEGEKDPERVRIVCFMTDGYVGNDMAIIDAIRKNVSTSRVFSFGIGRGVNRYLLDNMARAGRGEVEYVYDPKTAEAAATRFYDRINAPVLTDISIDWGELKDAVVVDELYPKLIPDLFSVKPVVIKGRYKVPAADLTGKITIRGLTGEGKFERTVSITLPAAAGNKALAPMWARAKVDHLMDRTLAAAQLGKPDPAIKERIVGLGMEFSLLTQYTSFVAVEEKTVTIGGESRRVEVPVEMPEGVSYEGVFGHDGSGRVGGGRGAPGGKMMLRKMYKPAMFSAGSGGGGGGGGGGSMREAEGERRDRATDAKSNLKQIKENKKLTDTEKKAKVAETKLAKVLQGLAAKLDKDGNYSAGKVVVKNGKIEVAVYLYEMDDKALAALKKLGFVKLLDSKAVKMVLGSIEVKKLEELAWLDAVRRVELPSFAK